MAVLEIIQNFLTVCFLLLGGRGSVVDFVRQITAEEKECGKAIEKGCQVWYANLLNGMLWLTEQLGL